MDFNLWKIGFILLTIGLGVPIAYGVYKFILSSIAWYWRASIICIILGCIFLLISAAREQMQSSKPKEEV